MIIRINKDLWEKLILLSEKESCKLENIKKTYMEMIAIKRKKLLLYDILIFLYCKRYRLNYK